jgi:hypothetical protein
MNFPLCDPECEDIECWNKKFITTLDHLLKLDHTPPGRYMDQWNKLLVGLMWRWNNVRDYLVAICKTYKYLYENGQIARRIIKEMGRMRDDVWHHYMKAIGNVKVLNLGECAELPESIPFPYNYLVDYNNHEYI